jgi:hypothetical protein
MPDEMREFAKNILVACFAGTWIILFIVNFCFFWFRGNVAFKRKWFPRFVALTFALFVLFATSIAAFDMSPLQLLTSTIILVLIAGLIFYVGLKTTRFCDQCGGRVIQMNWFKRMKHCQRCGAELSAPPRPAGPE